MLRTAPLRSLLACVIGLFTTPFLLAQSFPFTSGPIPPCATSTFTANVSNVGYLGSPSMYWMPYLQSITLNITTDHPQTLSIAITSPAGTTLLLSEFNGGGGQNYTGTTFDYWSSLPITSGTAPFTGNWSPQGGSLSVFEGQMADGTWTISVTDTACANGGVGPGGDWTPGWFDGNAAGGAFAFGFSSPPPCQYWLPSETTSICPGGSVDMQGFYTLVQPWFQFTFTQNGTPVPDPSAITAEGSYEVYAYDPWEGCSYWANYAVSIDSPVDLGPDRVVQRCPGSPPSDLTALFTFGTAGQTWTYNGAATTISAATTATQPGSYTVIAWTSAGCNDTAQVTVVELPGPMLGLDQALGICAGTTVDVTSYFNTSGTTAIWSFGSTLIPPPVAASAPGLYSLEAIDLDGCIGNAAFTLTLQPTPSLGPDVDTTFCAGSSLDLAPLFATGGLPAVWYLNGAVVPAAATVEGSYLLVVGGASSCSDSVFVTVEEVPVPDLGQDQTLTLCAGSTTDLTTLVPIVSGPLSWWHDNVPYSTPEFASTAGTYVVTTENGGACADTLLITVNTGTQPTLGADQTVQACTNTPVDLGALVNATPYPITWTYVGAPVANPSAVQAGGTYRAVTTSGGLCSDTLLITVDMHPSPILGPDGQASVCAGEAEDITGYFNTLGLTSTWTFGGVTISDATAVTEAGPYTLVATNAAGCQDTAQVTLTVDPLPVLEPATNLTVCAGSSVDLVDLYTAPAHTFVWTFGGVAVLVPSAVVDAGIYTVEATNLSGCSATTTVTINHASAPALGMDAEVPICDGATTDLTSLFTTDGLQAVWSVNGTSLMDATAVPAGHYQLIASNSAACSDTAYVTVTAHAAPDLGGDRQLTLCMGRSIALNALVPSEANATYMLSGEPVSSPDSVAVAGAYTIFAENAVGCATTISVNIVVIECPCVADFVYQGDCVQDPVYFAVEADSSITSAHWSFGTAARASELLAPAVLFVPGEDIVVRLDVRLSCGTVNLERSISLRDCSDSCSVWIPSAFTPNGDTYNDVWSWKGECTPEDFSMSIYDRLGETIFSTSDPHNAWDGTYAGSLSPAGVYAFRVGYRLPYQAPREATGHITLLR